MLPSKNHPLPTRRQFLATTAAATLLPRLVQARLPDETTPKYLSGYSKLYANDPRAAAKAWFADAGFGLFMHYGIASLLGRGEWVQYREAIPLSEYESLKDRFVADRFDADFITDMALEAGMKYVNLTTRHHDSFCLFESKLSDYSSVESPAKRDLVGELAEQCHAKGLGVFFYYSYALDWRHPYFYPRSYYPIARPAYKQPEPRYQFANDDDFQRYIDFVHGQIRELLTNYGPVAGMWFDPIMGYYAKPDLFPIDETYRLVRSLQPQTLISFKQGANGDEDFAAPERKGYSLADTVRQRCGDYSGDIAAKAWESNKDKHNEICDTMQPQAWGYNKKNDKQHLTAEQVVERLDSAASNRCNLLMNTGPLPDGSIHEADVRAFAKVGKLLATR
ncbi:alpha-L-fucosidase [Aeoliella mucimassa]|uniref:alpha-L-fucosidase n=1 Tax=Aeoliella mucimassa TaxID=2527972 RepID=A0A518AIN9_9BACT|nr:alpha-L-fucosidase [Aeoliella mucimassa]QDU54605.1 Alpha-L-fucosidase [Aeoliella mucimassa]